MDEVGDDGQARGPRPRGPVTGGWGFDDDGAGGPRMSAEPPSPQRGHKGHFEEDGPASGPEEGVDLAPLMQCLCSDRQVFEQDSTWDHELIFQEVASAINQDLLTMEEGEEEVDTMR
ncbi:unnamed protein product [Effrenium voratum]|nr:unnamed protein product [Effrenium voratum]